ncbi:MAG TPA: glycerophosphodiester phosphodiesterase family protein, partial [Puia sp.]|nr:glycerophosphodiester phosphodiesterase family protein [Puia sp.]
MKSLLSILIYSAILLATTPAESIAQIKSDAPPTSAAQPKLDVQGHRGGRGLMPENTIPAMVNAVALGVRTLELDCVISADG